MDRKGEITVFLAMILVSVCALLCGLAESARTAGARCSLRMAVNASMDSLMSQYHRRLWERYRILGLEYDKKESLEREMQQFLKLCLSAENWYPMRVEEIRTRDIVTLTQGKGRYMEREILEYMKYGLIDTVWDALTEEEGEAVLRAWKEGDSVSRISELYAGHTREAVRLEKALEGINDCLLAQLEGWEAGGERLESLDGRGFLSQAKGMVREFRKLPRLVNTYEKRADELGKTLQESREKFKAEQAELGERVRAALEEEIQQYESYVAADGERRREIGNLKNLAPVRIQWIEDVIREAEAVMEYIDSWEPEDEEDELDEEALWSPVQGRWSSYERLSLGIEFGVKDKEKEGVLEKIGDMAAGGLLELVLPEGTLLSGKSLDLGAVPSKGQMEGEGGGTAELTARERIKGAGSLVDRIIIGEYAIRFFQVFEKEMPENSFYELEYILQGKEGDRDNLAGVAARLTTVRQGLNLAHILSDSAKRQEARALAMAIVGAAGFMPLVSVVSFFVMAVWALGEALVDVRNLLNKERVPLIKGREEWNLGLEGLLDIGRNRGLGDNPSAGAGGRGLNYKGYLRIFLFTGYKAELIYRMMDVMQINIGRNQPGFSIAGCGCMVDMEVQVRGKHVFFSPGLWKSQAGGDLGYSTNMEVSGSYLEGK